MYLFVGELCMYETDLCALRCFHTSSLAQDPDRLHSLLEASLALSTSTRPFDSVTAAHLLNLLLHQPHLQPALLLCGQQQGILLQPPHPGEPQASEQASTLERNTFARKSGVGSISIGSVSVFLESKGTILRP